MNATLGVQSDHDGGIGLWRENFNAVAYGW
jgi:hypothetical protein